MFDSLDEERLIRLMAKNEVMLFLGAGFSYNAENALGDNFPIGNVLGKKLWELLGYVGDYDNTPLPEMYQAFINSPIKKDLKKAFLESNLLSGTVPEIYNIVAAPYWYKIYTLNIDDVLDKVYKRENRKIQVLKYPVDDFEERDQSLDSTQIIHLNGKLPSDPADVIFSTTQYAKASLTHQPLYGQFVSDYAVKTVIFIGTEINEPIFETYLEARDGRRRGVKEYRPKSFLITPHLSPVKVDNYKTRYNVTHIPGTTEQFLKWLKDVASELPTREEILKVTFPNIINLLHSFDFANNSDLRYFAETFSKVPSDYKLKNERSGYLIGASPTWNDIFRELDISRSITSRLLDTINLFFKDEKAYEMNILSLSGTAGSGKSTIFKRLGLQLVQEGHPAFLAYSDYLPNVNYLYNALGIIKQKSVLIFDNAENIIFSLPKLISVLNKLEFPPVILLSVRTSSSNKLNTILPTDINYHPFNLPDLDDNEITDLIGKLEENNLLGILKGMTPKLRFEQFKLSAKKQILIALKEATSGKLFEDIIKDEFDKIDPYEAQVLCVCVALSTSLGFTSTKQDFVGFSKDSSVEALDYLENTLSGTIMWAGNSRDKFMIRHRIVADFIIKHCCTLALLKEAYVRVLSVLAPELKNRHSPSRKFNLYRSLINHQSLYERFQRNINEAREVFDSISAFFNNDSQYWLQYGCLELEGRMGDMTLAENYINQAESLNPTNPYITNAKCSLCYKKSLVQETLAKAHEYKQQGDDLAVYLLEKFGPENSYIYHIFCRGRYEYMKAWGQNLDENAVEVRYLLSVVDRGIKYHQYDRRLITLREELYRAYLNLGISSKPINIDFDSNM